MQKKMAELPKKVGNEHYKSDRLKSTAQLRAVERRRNCTGLLGFYVGKESISKKIMNQCLVLESGIPSLCLVLKINSTVLDAKFICTLVHQIKKHVRQVRQ